MIIKITFLEVEEILIKFMSNNETCWKYWKQSIYINVNKRKSCKSCVSIAETLETSKEVVLVYKKSQRDTFNAY